MRVAYTGAVLIRSGSTGSGDSELRNLNVKALINGWITADVYTGLNGEQNHDLGSLKVGQKIEWRSYGDGIYYLGSRFGCHNIDQSNNDLNRTEVCALSHSSLNIV